LTLSLQDQFLECFAGDRVLDLRSLGVTANYDPLGRALRRLVAVASSCGSGGVGSASPTESPRPRRPRSPIGLRGAAPSKARNVFLRCDFEKLGSYDDVGRALRRLTEKGRLVQIGYELYAKAQRSPFSGKAAPVVGISRHAAEPLSRLGKTVEECDFSKDYSSGRSPRCRRAGR
jgi:hypothetical protein